jgi:hypothetical protein
MRYTVLALLLAGWPCLPQEYSLPQYLQHLRNAPGATISDKVEYLSGIGITLSSRGRRELEAAGSGRSTTPAVPFTTRSPRGRAADSISGNSTITGNGRWTSYQFSNGVSGSSNRSGNTTFYQFSNGLSGANTDIGTQSFQNFSNGLTGNTFHVGQQTFQNWSDGSSSISNRIGNTTYYNFNNGVTGTSTQIGNTTYYNFSDGRSCTTTRIGNQTNTNCQ